MLDISFYSANGHSPITIDVSENFYQWLSRSEFSQIGMSHPHKMKIDTDEILLNVVDLNRGDVSNRQQFKKFLIDNFVNETDALLAQLIDPPLPPDFHKMTYKLRKLQELRKCIEDENYQYLERF